jgi:E3 ubiquitin-protein ligase HERC3
VVVPGLLFIASTAPLGCSSTGASGSSTSSGGALAPTQDAAIGDGGNGQADAGSVDGDGDGGGPDASSDGGLAPIHSKFLSFAGGHRNTCAIYNDGRLFCFGGNDSGQLGDGSTKDRGADPGTLASLVPVDLGSGAKATQVVIGDSHVCALLEPGQVKCWGSNEQGQLGLEDRLDRGDKPGQMGAALPSVQFGAGRSAKKLAAGVDFTCALLDDMNVKCWGRNNSGQLGQGKSAVYVGGEPGDMGDALPAVNLGTGRKAVDVSVGDLHACALLDDRSVKCWGNNQWGQLGYGDTSARGRQASTMGDNLPVVDLGTGKSAAKLLVGFQISCANLSDGSLKCWGNNTTGQFGLGDTKSRGATPGSMGDSLPAIVFAAGHTVSDVALGEGSTCAVLDDQRVKCVGENSEGQLGYGDRNARGRDLGTSGENLSALDFGAGRKLESISAGARHFCAAFADKSLRCWGRNDAGQLGLGNRVARGSSPGEVGIGLAAAELPQ